MSGTNGSGSAVITITHTRAEGTLCQGTSRGDGSAPALKAAGFRWSRSLGCWYVPQSRDKAGKSWVIGRAAEGLRAAGLEVATEVDSTTAGRTTAEVESERYERAQRRTEYHEEHAGRAAASADAAAKAEHAILDMIPPGQPILVGHHSERRHRRDLARADSLMRRSIAESERSEYHAQRAETSAGYRERREDIPRTLRRIAKLEADARRAERALAGREEYASDGSGGYTVTLVKPGERYAARLQAQLDSLREQIAYWRGHVEAAQESGAKVWGREDFTKGDFANRGGQWVEVLRVNAKSLTVPALLDLRPVATREGQQYSWTDTLPYDKVTGRKSAGEMAALLERAKAEPASA